LKKEIEFTEAGPEPPESPAIMTGEDEEG